MKNDMENIRRKLIKLAKDKEIPYTQVKIKKMNYSELENVWAEHKAKELDHVNETFADIIIVKFDELMKNYNWVKPSSKLGQKLQDRKLFKNDVKTVVSYFTPLLPFLGLIEGGAVVASEVMVIIIIKIMNTIHVRLHKGVNKIRIQQNPINTNAKSRVNITRCVVAWSLKNVRKDLNDSIVVDSVTKTIPDGYYTFSDLKTALAKHNLLPRARWRTDVYCLALSFIL